MDNSLASVNWQYFKVGDLFEILNGKGITGEEIENNPGELCAVQSASDNNAVMGKISLTYCIENGYTYVLTPCLTVARSGSAGYVSFQENGCVVGDSAKILILKNRIMNRRNILLFLQTILLKLMPKYTYGRKVTSTKYATEEIFIPVDGNNQPNWKFMDDFINSFQLNITPTPKTTKPVLPDITKWKSFLLHRLFQVEMGNGIDFILTSNNMPQYNYVSRDSNNNGVVGFVDTIDGEIPFPAGSMSLALGGSFLGSCFVQTKPFYTAQNVAVLKEKTAMSIYSKLFIATLIRNECKLKFQAFGRELNSHIRKDFKIKLPVLFKEDSVVIDPLNTFSDEGYIPDWATIENYMKSLSFSDEIS